MAACGAANPGCPAELRLWWAPSTLAIDATVKASGMHE